MRREDKLSSQLDANTTVSNGGGLTSFWGKDSGGP